MVITYCDNDLIKINMWYFTSIQVSEKKNIESKQDKIVMCQKHNIILMKYGLDFYIWHKTKTTTISIDFMATQFCFSTTKKKKIYAFNSQTHSCYVLYVLHMH